MYNLLITLAHFCPFGFKIQANSEGLTEKGFGAGVTYAPQKGSYIRPEFRILSPINNGVLKYSYCGITMGQMIDRH